MAKQLIFDEEARSAILKGVSMLTDAVKATLGPKGRNAILDKKGRRRLCKRDRAEGPLGEYGCPAGQRSRIQNI